MLSQNLEKTLHLALAAAAERRHEFATLEHLLIALCDDADAVAVMRACNVDLDQLRAAVTQFLDEDLREAGVIDAVTLDEAVIDSKWVADVTVEAKVAVVAGGELASGMKYTYATATDVTQRVGLEGVSAMLEA